MSKWIRYEKKLYNANQIQKIFFNDKEIVFHFDDEIEGHMQCENDLEFERLVAWLDDKGASGVLDISERKE